MRTMVETRFAVRSQKKRVKRNKGAGGVDGMKVNELLQYLKDNGTVDMDLEKFFDTVNQSKLIEILSRDIKDGRVISLIHKYLKAGVVECGRFVDTEMGVPQGGPLSPLCANIMLNEPDHELERRGHKFVRYADNMVIFCKSKASAMQTPEHIIPFIEAVSQSKPRENSGSLCRENQVSRLRVLQEYRGMANESSQESRGQAEEAGKRTHKPQMCE